MSQETLLKDAIAAMTSEVRGMDGLAATAIAQGKRIRRRQRVMTAAAVLAAFGIISSFFFWRPATEQQSAMPAPVRTINGPEKGLLPGNWTILAAPASQNVTRLDGKSTLTADVGDVVSPSGRFVMRADPGAGEFVLTIKQSGREPVTLQVPGGESFAWSPVADTILATVSNMDGVKGFATVDAASARVSTHVPVSIPSSYCGPCKFSWYPKGNEVVVRQAEDFTDAGGNFTGRGSTYLFDAMTGRPSRSLTFQVNVSGPGSWSPDGRYALSESSLGSQLIDLEQRIMVRQLPGRAWFNGDGQLLVLTQKREVVVMRPDGTVLEVIALGGTYRTESIVLAPAGS
jgi:hypothetical protein